MKKKFVFILVICSLAIIPVILNAQVRSSYGNSQYMNSGTVDNQPAANEIVGNTGGPPNVPTDPEDIPIDGGLSLLIATGVAYGVKKGMKKRKGSILLAS